MGSGSILTDHLAKVHNAKRQKSQFTRLFVNFLLVLRTSRVKTRWGSGLKGL